VFKAINPNYLSFLSGIMATIGIEIYLQIILTNSLRLFLGLYGGSLILLSSFSLTSLSLALQGIYERAIIRSPPTIDPETKATLHRQIIEDSAGRLIFLVYLAFVFFIAGIVFTGLARVSQ